MQKKVNNKNKMIIMLLITTFFINFKGVSANMCNSMPKTIGIINDLLGLLKIAIPIILIILGAVGFVKAIIAKDDQGMKKAQSTFITRLIIGVAIFFVPGIMQFLLGIIGYGDSCLYDILNF